MVKKPDNSSDAAAPLSYSKSMWGIPDTSASNPPPSPPSPKRPGARHTRDTERTRVCIYCGTSYHPWTHLPKQVFCSKVCSAQAKLARVNGQMNDYPAPMPVRDTVSLPLPTLTKSDELGENWRHSGEHWDKVAAWWHARQESERKRIAQQGSAYNTLASEGRTITLSGYGARLFVKNNRLVCQSGRTYSTQEQETHTLFRGIHGVSSIIWLANGGAGSLSIESLKWAASQNITIRVIAYRGEHLATIHPSPDAPQALGIPKQENGRADIKLRRAQYALAPAGNDVPMARKIILRKLEAQLKCLTAHPELPDWNRGYAAVDMAIQWLSLDPPTPATSTVDGIRLYEANASKGYFMSWRGLPLKIDSKAASNWPDEWKVIAERKSPLTRWMSPKNAVNPAQSLLNFAYSMLESQVRAALYAIGADPACGVLHGDKDARDSLVYDVMEGLRGEVDHLLLEFIKVHVFSAGDFTPDSAGAISLHPSLARVLATMVRLSQRRADDEARWLRSELFHVMST